MQWHNVPTAAVQKCHHSRQLKQVFQQQITPLDFNLTMITGSNIILKYL